MKRIELVSQGLTIYRNDSKSNPNGLNTILDNQNKILRTFNGFIKIVELDDNAVLLFEINEVTKKAIIISKTNKDYLIDEFYLPNDMRCIYGDELKKRSSIVVPVGDKYAIYSYSKHYITSPVFHRIKLTPKGYIGEYDVELENNVLTLIGEMNINGIMDEEYLRSPLLNKRYHVNPDDLDGTIEGITPIFVHDYNSYILKKKKYDHEYVGYICDQLNKNKR